MLTDLGLQTQEQISEFNENSVCLCIGVFTCPNCGYENGERFNNKKTMTNISITTLPFETLNDLARLFHNLAKEKGFYDQPETDDQYIARSMMNLHGEVSELWEGYRKGVLDQECDKGEKMKELGLRPLTNKEEELADIVIRVLETSNRLGINIGEVTKIKHQYNQSREYRHGNKKA